MKDEASQASKGHIVKGLMSIEGVWSLSSRWRETIAGF